jgi:uncharacterized protein YneF (UPF0154 family)
VIVAVGVLVTVGVKVGVIVGVLVGTFVGVRVAKREMFENWQSVSSNVTRMARVRVRVYALFIDKYYIEAILTFNPWKIKVCRYKDFIPREDVVRWVGEIGKTPLLTSSRAEGSGSKRPAL